MDKVPRSSFIPKQATGSSPNQAQAKRAVSIFGILSTVLFFGTLLAAAALFGYSYYLEGRIEARKSALVEEYQRFSESEITGVRSADEKLRAARYLLDNHTSPSKIFDALERNTKQSVQYRTFAYERRPSGNITLNITGVTTEFAKVSLQWTQYLQNVVLADVTMTRIGLGFENNEEGRAIPIDKQVDFSLIANIDAENIAYAPTSAAVPEEEPESESETATTSEETLDTGDDAGGGDGTAPSEEESSENTQTQN